MSDHVFSLAYTSVRPTLIPQVVALWQSRALNKNIEWAISTDEGHTHAIDAIEKVAATPGVNVKLVVNKGHKNCVDGWNAAAAATTGKVIIAVSDDFVPPHNWDALLLGLSPENWVDGEHVVHVSDGFCTNICTLAILTRKRYDKFGYLWYPLYQSMFVDTDFTDTAYKDGVVLDAKHLLFEHMHYVNNKRTQDAADLAHENPERWNYGQTLYNYRKSNGFPLDQGPNAVEHVVSVNRKYAAYLQVTKDDFCLYETCQRLREEGVNDFYFSVPDTYWDGRRTPQADLKSVSDIVDRLRREGAKVSVKVFRVALYVFPGENRLQTETRLRNDALGWIRSNGFSDILIVDGDELWLPGTLTLVNSLVNQGHLAISVRMVPVVGLPGYPVEAATDVAVVYIGGACQFRMCRTPQIEQTVIQQPRIIHFTATRKTMDEIIAKHRASGHYDDPDYAFEEWFVKTLPFIKPGFKNAHMYKPYQIWPQVRDWRPEELAIIPESLYPYITTK